jgi:hypothetical protein
MNEVINYIVDGNTVRETIISPDFSCVANDNAGNGIEQIKIYNTTSIVSILDSEISRKVAQYNISIRPKSLEKAKNLLGQLSRFSFFSDSLSEEPKINVHPMGHVSLFWNPADKIYVSLVFIDDEELLLIDDKDFAIPGESNVKNLCAKFDQVNSILRKYQ